MALSAALSERRPRRRMALTPSSSRAPSGSSPSCRRDPADPSPPTRSVGALVDRLLAERDGEPIWVFAYGSLIWKPVFAPDAIRRGTAAGWHRAFTLRIERFRGTPDRPGLMMALARGGRCTGLLLRLPDRRPRGARPSCSGASCRSASPVDGPLDPVATDDGPVPALVFWAGRFPPLTADGLSPEATARQLAHACGHVGSCADYLYQTVAHLEEHGMRDRNLWRLHAWLPPRSRAGTPDSLGG